MKHLLLKPVFISFLAVCSLSVLAQDDIIKTRKPINIWIYTKENIEQKGVLIGASNSSLFMYEGSMTAYQKETSPHLANISYENIRTIKVKKKGALLKGLLVGAGIGLSPVFFGQGGAYVAVLTFPLGIIVGSVVGATSKKKYKINGDAQTFARFTLKYVK